jgi:hypothetical protein
MSSGRVFCGIKFTLQAKRLVTFDEPWLYIPWLQGIQFGLFVSCKEKSKGIINNNFNIKKKNQNGFDLPFWLPELGYFGFIPKRLQGFPWDVLKDPSSIARTLFPDCQFFPAKFESASFLLIFPQRQTNHHVDRTLTPSVRKTENQWDLRFIRRSWSLLLAHYYRLLGYNSL